MVDVSVLNSNGLPQRAYLSMRIGDTRRLAPFQHGEAFHFPSAIHQSMYVDVFEKIGSTQISLATLQADGSQLEDASIVNSSGQKMDVSLKIDKVDKSMPRPGSARETRHKAALRAKSYLDNNAIQNLLQQMVHSLLENQPGEPIDFMTSFLNKNRHTFSNRPKTADPSFPEKKSVASELKSEKKPAAIQQIDAEKQMDAKSTPIETAPQETPFEMPGKGPDDYPGFPADKCPEQLPDLSKHYSIMADVFRSDPQLYDRLKDVRTDSEPQVSFARCIKPGVDNRGHPMIKTVGAVAADESSYKVFSQFFDKILAQMHPTYEPGAVQTSRMDPSLVNDESIDPDGAHVISCTLRISRSVRNFHMPAAVSKIERRDIERLLAKACLDFPDGIQGDYFPVSKSTSYVPKPRGMTAEEEKELLDAHLLFHEPDSTLMLSAGVGRDWPDARGIFVDRNRDLMVWINYEDHVRITAMENGGDMKSAFARLCLAESSMRGALEDEGSGFMQDDHYGYLCSCPSNTGTTLRASAAVKLPLLSTRADFKAICKDLGLQARGGYNLEQTPRAGCWSLSNAAQVGLSEDQILNSFISGCAKVVRLEKALEAGESIPAQPESVQRAQTEPVQALPRSPAPDIQWPAAATQGLGDEPYPGFPCDKCPTTQPDLSRHHNAMAEVLQSDPSIWPRMKDVVTESGVNLAMCVKPGVDNMGHPFIKTVGIVAGDEDSYSSFKDIFDPVIESRHEGYGPDATHSTNLDHNMVKDVAVDPDGKYVKSIRIRANRNLRGLCLPPVMPKQERREVERAAVTALLTGCGGTYFPLVGSNSYVPIPNGMTVEQEAMLREANFLFQEPDSALLLSSGVGRHWPDARGIFLSTEKDCAVWVNYEDHLIVTATAEGADIKGAFGKFSELQAHLAESLKSEEWEFMHNEHLGFITSCPSNLGTAMRVQVTVQVPLLSEHKDFKAICSALKISVRRKIGGHEETLWEIMNSTRLGTSEVDIMNDLIENVKTLVDLEKKLEAGEEVGVPGKPEASATPAAGEEKVVSAEPVRGFGGVPGLGDAEFPGFDAGACPETQPDLSSHHSVMAKVLRDDPSIWTRLYNVTTDAGVTFGKCIKSGMDNPGHPMIKTVGFVAGDEGSYASFSDLCNPIISVMHNQYAADGLHVTNLDPTAVTDVQLDSKYAVCVRISTARNVSGYNLPSAISKSDRRDLERLVVKGLLGAFGDMSLTGDYYPLVGSSSYLPKPGGMSLEEEQMMADGGFLFQDPDSKLLLASGMGRHWPDARGLFLSKEKDILVWVNEEDHIRMVIKDSGSDLKVAFTRFCKLESILEASLSDEGCGYMKNNQIGFIFACPSNLGTGMRCSVQLKIPLMSEYLGFKQICKALNLQARLLPESEVATSGSSVWDLSNTAKLGTSEVDLVNSIIESCSRLIEMEKKLEASESIEELLPKM